MFQLCMLINELNTLGLMQGFVGNLFELLFSGLKDWQIHIFLKITFYIFLFLDLYWTMSWEGKE